MLVELNRFDAPDRERESKSSVVKWRVVAVPSLPVLAETPATEEFSDEGGARPESMMSQNGSIEGRGTVPVAIVSDGSERPDPQGAGAAQARVRLLTWATIESDLGREQSRDMR